MKARRSKNIGRHTRKDPVLPDGTMRPFTKLVRLVRTNPELREKLFAAWDELHGVKWIRYVNAELGLNLSENTAHVTRFKDYVKYLRAVDLQNDRIEAIRAYYREKFPDETEDQIDNRAILHFKRDAFATGDRDGYIDIGKFSLARKSCDADIVHKERGDDIKERMLEQKLENARKLIETEKTPGGLSPEVIAKIERELNLF